MRRFLLLVLALAIVLAAIASVWIGAPIWAKAYLAGTGLGKIDFVIDGMSLRRLSVSDVRFGLHQEQRISRLVVFFRPVQLLSSGRVEGVLIEGADLRLARDENGLFKLAGVDLPRSGTQTDRLSVPALPVTSLHLRDSLVRLDTAAGALRLPLNAIFTEVATGAWGLNADIVPEYAGAQAVIALEARVEANGQVRIEADVKAAEGWLPDMPGALAEGWISVERDSAGRISLLGTLDLEAAESLMTIDLAAEKGAASDSDIAYSLAFDLPDLSLERLSRLADMPVRLRGRTSLQAHLDGRLPPEWNRVWRQGTAEGQASLRLEGVAVDDLIANLATSIETDLSIAGTALTVTPVGPWEATGRLTSVETPVAFRLSSIAGEKLVLTMDVPQARRTAAGTLGFSIEWPPWPRLTGIASGRIERTPKQALAFELDRVRIDPAHWNFDGLELRSKEIEAQLQGTASRIEGRASVAVAAAGSVIDEGEIGDGEASADVRFVYAGQDLRLEIEDCVRLKAQQLRLAGLRWLEPLELCARQPEGDPLLSRLPSGALRLEVVLPSHPTQLAVDVGKTPLQIAGMTPELAVSATAGAAADSPALRVDTQGGRLKLIGREIELSDMEVTLRQTDTLSVSLTRAVARSLARPAEFTPLVFAGQADGRLDGKLAFRLEGAARDQGVPLKLSVSGEQDFALSLGELRYELEAIDFAPKGPRPADILPALDGLISKVQGSFSLRGGLSWVTDMPVAYTQLGLRDLGFDGPGLRVRGMSTRLTRAGRALRDKLAEQEVRVDLLDIGIPLRNGLIRFHARKAPTIRFATVRFAWGGGTLEVQPFDLRLDDLSAPHALTLKLADVRLDALLELIPIAGLTGTGTLSGRVPIRIRGAQVEIDQGSIRSDSPGVLRYRPKERPAFFARSSETELLSNALEDFRYDSLTIALNGKTRQDLVASISLSGANPSLYDGHPFKLNFNVSGELDTIIRRTVSVATFAERLGAVVSRYLR